jgi:ribosomal-protein-alanine N-acetyltransferase
MEIIETPRLLLHKVTPEMRRDMFRSQTQEELMRFFGITTQQEWELELQKLNEGLTGFRRSCVLFYLQEKISGQTIGSCNFHTWYLPHRRAEVGYALNNDEWKRKGYMKEALLPIIRYGFEHMDLNRIEASTAPDNIASQKLLKGIGFKEEGVMREHYYRDGIAEDSVFFGLLRKEFTL